MIDHLSPSSIQTYRKCGKQFYFSKVLGIEDPTHYAMTSYGSAMHRAIEELYKNKTTKEQFINAFQNEWGLLSKEVTQWKNDSFEYLLKEGCKACEDF